jgi:membrane protein required for beta-lactamase induction
MTIISILLAFTLCHFVRELRHLRRFEWVSAFTSFCNDNCKNIPGWSGPVGFFIIIGLPLLTAWFINYSLSSLLGQLGELIVAITVLIYTFGPRDLYFDVLKLITAGD